MVNTRDRYPSDNNRDNLVGQITTLSYMTKLRYQIRPDVSNFCSLLDNAKKLENCEDDIKVVLTSTLS